MGLLAAWVTLIVRCFAGFEPQDLRVYQTSYIVVAVLLMMFAFVTPVFLCFGINTLDGTCFCVLTICSIVGTSACLISGLYANAWLQTGATDWGVIIGSITGMWFGTYIIMQLYTCIHTRQEITRRRFYMKSGRQ